ncbi:MAG: glutamate-5-semialdehyde dehydrogenase [Verrucomicrobia bacterium]|nr:glutamate-5-semialdehyde dehydrogenase [Verrucomicrobiota bacterium]
MLNLHQEMVAVGQRARAAARALNRLNARKKNIILEAMADALDAARETILAANARDLEEARNAGLSAAMLDRLTLTPARLRATIKGVRDVATLKDPIGGLISQWIRPNGLKIVKRRVPIGVICIIYESRPNVTVDTAALCIKTSNAVILRGGKESRYSNAALAEALIAGGCPKGLPEHAIQLIGTTDRGAVKELVQLEGLVDLVIPRGGETLIRAVAEHARVPVIKHYKGVCHVYVDADANRDMALNVIENAKCSRPGVCNAIETVLVHEQAAADFLPKFAARMKTRKVELRGDEATRALIPDAKPATEDDWSAEYLDLILAVRVVPSLDAAIDHINQYGTHLADAIVTDAEDAQKTFQHEVDSATVYVNASTRFTDGGEFGMGAEIGISTEKLHARGPMGLDELTTYKYLIYGKGQVRG